MNIEQIEPNSGAGIQVSGSPAGQFLASNEDTDKWLWDSDAWFPAGGFKLTFTSPTSIKNPSVVFTSQSFSTARSTPKRQWSGSQIFEIDKNGTLCGWFEAYVSRGAAKLMWWSNGTQLDNQKIRVVPGDVLSFTPGSLPSSKQYPLNSPQT